MNGMTAMLALSGVDDNFITESILPGAEDSAAGTYAPDTPGERRRARRARILESFSTGWGVAAACVLVCGAVLFALVRAGLGSPADPAAGSGSADLTATEPEATEADRTDGETDKANRAYFPVTTPAAGQERQTSGEPRIPSPTYPSVELPTFRDPFPKDPTPHVEYPTFPSNAPWKRMQDQRR